MLVDPGSINSVVTGFSLRNSATQVLQPTPRLWHLGGISLLVTVLEVVFLRWTWTRRPALVHGDAHEPKRHAKNPWLMFGLAVGVAIVGIGVQIFLVLANPIPIL